MGISAEKISAGKKFGEHFRRNFSARNFWFGLYFNSFRNGIFRDLIFDWINRYIIFRKIDYGIVGGWLEISFKIFNMNIQNQEKYSISINQEKGKPKFSASFFIILAK